MSAALDYMDEDQYNELINRQPPAPDVGQIVRATEARYGLPRGILDRMIAQESNGNPRAVSPAGAMGLLQLMPDTARGLGVTDPFDPGQNVDAGARYLRQMLDRYGDVPTALAAYNAGPGNVDRYGGVPPFEETQRYLQSILGTDQGTPTAAPMPPPEPVPSAPIDYQGFDPYTGWAEPAGVPPEYQTPLQQAQQYQGPLVASEPTATLQPEPQPANNDWLSSAWQNLRTLDQNARQYVPGYGGLADLAGPAAEVGGQLLTPFATPFQYAMGIESQTGPNGMNYPMLRGPGVGLQQLAQDIANPQPFDQPLTPERNLAESLQGQSPLMQAAGPLVIGALNPGTWTAPGGMIDAARTLGRAAEAAGPVASRLAEAAPAVARTAADAVAPDVLQGLERMGAMKSFAEQGAGPVPSGAELRPPEPGFAGNIRLERFSSDVRPLLEQTMSENNAFAGQRRGVIPDAQVRTNAAELALNTPIDTWLKSKPGRAFNAEEATALGLTLDRVGTEFNTLSTEVDAARTTGTLTAQQEAALAQKALQFASLEAVRSGAAAEAGRALRSFTQALQGGAAYKLPQAEAIKRAFKAIGTDQTAFTDWMTKWNALAPEDKIGRYKLLQALYQPTKMQKLTAWTTSNMLSSLKTLEVNFTSNMINSINRPLVTALGGSPRAAIDDVAAMGRAIGKAWGDAGTAFMTGIRPSRIGDAADLGKYDVYPEAFPGKQGLLATPALRVMSWGDEFARVINSASALANVARRESRATGKTVQELLANPTDSMLTYAQDAADAAVYEGKPSPVAQLLLKGRSLINQEGAANRATGMAFYVLTPFVRVPETVFVKGTKMLAKPITGPVQTAMALRKGNVAEAQRHIGETLLASGALTAIYGEAAAGNITGDGPQDPSRRKVLEEARDAKGNPIWQAHSIRIGDRCYDYTNLGHYAIPLATMANAVEAYRYEGKKPDPEYAAAVLDRTAKVMADASYIRTLGNVFKAIGEGNASNLATSIPTDIASRFVPYGGALAQTARTLDTQVKNPKNALEGVAARIPGANQLVRDKLSAFGKPVEQPVDLWSTVSPFKTSAAGTPNPAAVELARLGMGLSMVGDSITLPGQEEATKLTPEQQRTYQQAAGQAAEAALTVLAQKDWYVRASDTTKQGIIQNVTGRVRRMIREDITAQVQGQKPPRGLDTLLKDSAEYVDALYEKKQYDAMPVKLGMSKEDLKTAGTVGSYLSDRAHNTGGPTRAFLDEAAQRFGVPAVELYLGAQKLKPNPERREFWTKHPLLHKYFSDAKPEDVAR